MPSARRLSPDALSDLVPESSSPQSPRSEVLPSDVCVGCILWVPKLSFYKMEEEWARRLPDCGQIKLRERGYNHPVLVLKIRQRKSSVVSGDLICTVAIITSFSDMSLSKYLSCRSNLVNSLPIHRSADIGQDLAVHEAHTELQLEKGTLHKQSYVRLDRVYEIPVSLLQTYCRGVRFRAFKVRLAESSCKIVMKSLGMPPENYEVYNTLFETADARLLALSRSEMPPRSVSREQPPPPVSSRLVFAPVAQSQAQYQAHFRHPQPVAVQEQRLLHNYSVYNTSQVYSGPVSSGRTDSRSPLLPTHCCDPHSDDGDDENHGWFRSCFTTLALVGIGFFGWWYFSS